MNLNNVKELIFKDLLFALLINNLTQVFQSKLIKYST